MSKKIKHNLKNILTASVSDTNKETGCTLLYFPQGAIGAVDARGGSVAAREESSISSLNLSAWVDGIVLAGGSTYGLEAASGVMQKILEKRKFSTVFNDIPCVPAACVYDFRYRNSSTYPDVEMGKKAFDHLQEGQIEIGQIGAGTNTFVGKVLKQASPEKAGLGAYSLDIDGCSILAVSVVNALGNIVNFKGEIVRGSLGIDGRRLSIAESQNETDLKMGNTTISCLVINAELSRTELNRLTVMVHTAMAKVIDPFHTPFDGDVLFAVVPNGDQVKVKDFMRLASACCLAMQHAVLSSIE